MRFSFKCLRVLTEAFTPPSKSIHHNANRDSRPDVVRQSASLRKPHSATFSHFVSQRPVALWLAAFGVVSGSSGMAQSNHVPVYAYEAPGPSDRTHWQNFVANILPNISGFGITGNVTWSGIDNCSSTGPCASESAFNWRTLDQQLNAYITGVPNFSTACVNKSSCKILFIVRPTLDGGTVNDHTPQYVFSQAYATFLNSPPQDVVVCGTVAGGTDAYWKNVAAPVTGNFSGNGTATWNVTGATILHGSGLSITGSFPTTNFSGYPVVYEKPFLTAYENFIHYMLIHYSASGSGLGPTIAPFIGYIRFGIYGGENDPVCSTIGALPPANWASTTAVPAGFEAVPTSGNAGNYYFVTNGAGTTGGGPPAWCQKAYCNTAVDGSVSGWRNTGFSTNDLGEPPNPANSMWPGPKGQAAEPNSYSDNGYISTWGDADGIGFYASLINFLASQASSIPLDTSAHVGAPMINYAYADAESIIASGQNIGFGPQGLNIEDPITFAAGVAPTTLNDFAQNFLVFQNTTAVRHLQSAVAGGNASQFQLTNIVISGGTATAACSNGDCSIYCEGDVIGGVIPAYISGAGDAGLNGTVGLNSTCSANTVSFSTTVANGTYPGGAVWGINYLPIILPFASQAKATTVELHECTLDYTYGTSTNPSCRGTSGPDSAFQSAIQTLIGNGLPPLPPTGLKAIVN